MTIRQDRKGFSWNTHCILTRVALENVGLPRLNHKVAVVALEDFLASAQEEAPKLLHWYWGLIAKKRGNLGDNLFVRRVSPVVSPHDFLEAMRLNPDVRFHYVRALLPEEVAPHVLHDQSREGPPGCAYFPTAFGELIPAIEALATFSDEPDWGMDQDLFPIAEYGYGPSPFGSATGMSSQAPFHMAFLHENRLMRAIVPRLCRSFMAERFRGFMALSNLAFKKGIDYWGWRFLAWAVHYLQDLTQPYHAKAFPPSHVRAFKRLFLNLDFWKSSRLARNYVRNRHMLFEATMHFMLNEAAANQAYHPFLNALAHENNSLVGTWDEVMKEAAKEPAHLARQIDTLTVRLLNDPRVEDINYSLDQEPDTRIDRALDKAAAERPHILNELVDLVCPCLAQAGRVTRYTVNLAEAAH